MYSNVVAPLGARGRRKDKLLCRVRNTRLGQELHKQLCWQGKIVIDMPLRGQKIAAQVQEQAARLRRGRKLLNQLCSWIKLIPTQTLR